MMKKLLVALATSISLSAFAKTETIKIYSPYSPGHSGTPALLRVVDEANTVKTLQEKYKQSLEKSKGLTQ